MVKSEVDNSKGRRIRWAWPVAAALVAVLFAIAFDALASRGAPTLSLLDSTTKRCPCAPVRFISALITDKIWKQ